MPKSLAPESRVPAIVCLPHPRARPAVVSRQLVEGDRRRGIQSTPFPVTPGGINGVTLVFRFELVIYINKERVPPHRKAWRTEHDLDVEPYGVMVPYLSQEELQRLDAEAFLTDGAASTLLKSSRHEKASPFAGVV